MDLKGPLSVLFKQDLEFSAIDEGLSQEKCRSANAQLGCCHAGYRIERI